MASFWKKSKKLSSQTPTEGLRKMKQPVIPTSSSLNENKEKIIDYLDHSHDIGKRELTFQGKNALLLFFVPLMDSVKLDEHIIKPLLKSQSGDLYQVLNVGSIHEMTDIMEAVSFMCKGALVLIIEGETTIWSADATRPSGRQVSEALNERVMRGAQEGFVENVDTNINLLRRRIMNGGLIVKYIEIGSVSLTKVALVYIKGIANPRLLKEVTDRLNAIEVDALDTTGILEEAIEDSPFSPFPQILGTERPDRVVGNLLEGRIALMVEGSSLSLVAPASFISFYQSSEDYNSRSIYASFLRIIRILGFFMAMTLPSLYIATISFHYELIPQDLILTVKGSLENVPFPPIAEALLMVVILELLKEASVRLPASIAQTIGVVGGLVIGTAIVEANLVSNMMIIIIALTAISSFVVPSNEMSIALRLLSFPLMIGATFFGYLGIVLIFMVIIMHLCILESLGYPYFTPIAPLSMAGVKDFIIRSHEQYLNKRPSIIQPTRKQRQNALRNWEQQNETNE
ncbi:spore germination protein [Fictibacillus sp. KIGAM418]|uniref:Spore germination protein n=1 Tax=Fictibacillus marinisediminis TaxID=2878389 RepID=A0A9X1X9C2_9BACL|nr:spore germination protein [Fictibacillus marinisediminis]MCK6256401.1 spore germination protein [Fictibacillus marinisediminis]